MRTFAKRSIPAIVAVLPLLPASAGAAAHPYTAEADLDVTELYANARPLFADLDADGDDDVVVATQTHLWWYENTAGLTADMQERSVDPTLTVIDDVSAHDVDGDGDLDLVTSGNGVRWYENVESAATFVAHTIDTESLVGEIDAGDVDGDGDVDIVLADSYDDRVLWYANPGKDAAWAAPTQIPTMQYGAGILLVLDADGDGASDILVSDGEDAALRLLRYDGGPWIESALDPGSGAVSLAAGDLDDDGDLDVLCGQAQHAILFRNLGDGAFGVEQLEESEGLIIDFRLDHGDVDGDGDEDVVAVTHGSTQAVRWYAAEGDGYGPPQTIVDELYNSRGMDLSDADCDGDAEIVVHGDNGYWHVALLTNESAPADGTCEGSVDDTGGSEDPTAADESGDGAGDDDPPGTTSSTSDDGTPPPDDEESGTGITPQDDDEGGGGMCSIDPRGAAPLGLLALVLLGRRRRR